MKTIIFDLDGTLVGLQEAPLQYKGAFCGTVFYANQARLFKLRKIYRFALVTGATRTKTYDALCAFGVLDLFYERETNKFLIVTSDEVPEPKSTGKPFLEIKKHLNGDAIVIGDSDGDAIGAGLAGLHFVRVKVDKSVREQRRNFAQALDQALQLFA